MITVYVVISECGLNEHVLHYAGPYEPTKEQLQQWANEGGHYTGYNATWLYYAEGDQILKIGFTSPNWGDRT